MTIDCLRSLLATDWPADRLEIVLVDNGSVDDVVERVRAEMPDRAHHRAARQHRLRRRLQSRHPRRRGLRPRRPRQQRRHRATRAGSARSSRRSTLTAKIGAACPKIMFDGRYVEAEVDVPDAAPGSARDPRTLGVRLTAAALDGVRADERMAFDEGFFTAEEPDRETTARSSPAGRGAAAASGPSQATMRPPARLAVARRRARRPRTSRCVPTSTRRTASLGRAGTGVDRRRPRRRRVRRHQQRRIEPVPRTGSAAIAGSSNATTASTTSRRKCSPGVVARCCCRSAYLDDVGLFDERLFLYYEDTDLSWRGRLRGWRYVYVPTIGRPAPPRRIVRRRLEGVPLLHRAQPSADAGKNAPAGLAWRAAPGIVTRGRRRDRARPRVRPLTLRMPVRAGRGAPRGDHDAGTSASCPAMLGDRWTSGRVVVAAFADVVDPDEGRRRERRGAGSRCTTCTGRRSVAASRSPGRSPRCCRGTTTSRCSLPIRSMLDLARERLGRRRLGLRAPVRRRRRRRLGGERRLRPVHQRHLSQPRRQPQPARLVLRALPADPAGATAIVCATASAGRRQGAVGAVRACPIGSSMSAPDSTGECSRRLRRDLPAIPRQLPLHRGVGRTAVGCAGRGPLPTRARRTSSPATSGRASSTWDGSSIRGPGTARSSSSSSTRSNGPAIAGWELALAGGCDGANREYFLSARRAAIGQPIAVHVNAKGEVVRRLLAEASIYWHAGGFGEDPERHPERFEHFGIAVVEAMAAGAVPLVFAAGGPAEIVQHGVNGYHWRTLDELIALTRRLIADPGEHRRLAAAAQQRATDFSARPVRGRRDRPAAVTSTKPVSRHLGLSGGGRRAPRWFRVR